MQHCTHILSYQNRPFLLQDTEERSEPKTKNMTDRQTAEVTPTNLREQRAEGGQRGHRCHHPRQGTKCHPFRQLPLLDGARAGRGRRGGYNRLRGRGGGGRNCGGKKSAQRRLRFRGKEKRGGIVKRMCYKWWARCEWVKADRVYRTLEVATARRAVRIGGGFHRRGGGGVMTVCVA